MPRVPTPRRNEEAPPPWKVEGSGGRQDKKPARRPPNAMRIGLFIVALLAINWAIGSQIGKPKPRLEVPYSTFRAQVDKKNVKEVSSRGESIQGDFRHAVTFDGKSNIRFDTVQPAFSSDDQLLQLLLKQGVEVNATPVDSSPSFLVQLLVGFGPTILIVGLLFFAFRRGRGGGAGGIGGLGRSKAKRYDAGRAAHDVRRRRRASTRSRTSSPRSSTSSSTPTSTAGSAR